MGMNQDHAKSSHASDHLNADSEPADAVMRQLLAPALSIGLTWGARKVLDGIYKKKTGHEPPNSGDNTVPIGKALAWGALTAVVSTAIETIVNRAVANNDLVEEPKTTAAAANSN